MKHRLACGIALLAIGCSGSGASVADGTSGAPGAPGGSGSDAMFAAPSGTATPDSIYGLWGGTIEDGSITFDTRMRLSKGSATIAARCTTAEGKHSSTVGVTAAARISDEELAVLESKTDAKDNGVVKCSVSLTPKDVKRCTSDMPKGFERDCFKLEGMTLFEFGKTPLEKIELTKLSD